jgi:hypothetical protein
MDFDRESNRLFQVYDEKSNDELLALHSNREDLTDVAQDALARVMKDRGLAVPAVEMDAPHADAGAKADYDVVLWTFDDMFQANRAIQLLEEAQIEYGLVDLSNGGIVSQRYQAVGWLQLKIAEQDVVAARKALHDGMGLFPGAEVDAPDSYAGPLDDLTGVYLFDSETEMAQGLAVVQALAKAGVSFVWHDGRDWPEGLADAMTISIEVRQASAEHASAVVETCLA